MFGVILLIPKMIKNGLKSKNIILNILDQVTVGIINIYLLLNN